VSGPLGLTSPSANFTPASGRQDHTTSPSAVALFVCERIGVHRIPPRVRDDREPPLCVGRDPIEIFLFLPGRQAKFGNSEIAFAQFKCARAPPALPEQMAEASAVISIRAQDQHDCRLVDRLAEPQFS